MRSMLAGVAETGSETAQRLEGFASMRSMLAGLAERGCKKQSLSRLAPTAPFTQRSRKTRHFNHLAAPPHLFSSLLSLISAKRLF